MAANLAAIHVLPNLAVPSQLKAHKAQALFQVGGTTRARFTLVSCVAIGTCQQCPALDGGQLLWELESLDSISNTEPLGCGALVAAGIMHQYHNQVRAHDLKHACEVHIVNQQAKPQHKNQTTTICCQ